MCFETSASESDARTRALCNTKYEKKSVQHSHNCQCIAYFCLQSVSAHHDGYTNIIVHRLYYFCQCLRRPASPCNSNARMSTRAVTLSTLGLLLKPVYVATLPLRRSLSPALLLAFGDRTTKNCRDDLQVPVSVIGLNSG